MTYLAEYIWIDGTDPTAKLRSKTKVLTDKPVSKAAVKGLPMSVPRSDDKDALAAVDVFLDALSRDSRPKLMLWGECDLILGLAVGQRLEVLAVGAAHHLHGLAARP